MSTMSLSSITDAKTFVQNSGVADWEWGGDSSADGLANWLYQNHDDVDRENYDAELREYLSSVGENPADYDL